MSLLATKNKSLSLQLLAPVPLPPPIRMLPRINRLGMSNAHFQHSICLTFDDGPDPLHTPKILDVLAQYNAKATFFVLGEAAEQYPELIARMVKEGHVIGNHSFTHSHPWMMTSERAQYEVRKTTSLLKEITGAAPRWFRPPFGRLRDAMRRQAYEEKMPTVLWSRSIVDWGILGTKAGIARRMERIKPGDIVLLHDGERQSNNPATTLECLPRFLQSLADNELSTCTLDEGF